MTATTTKRPTTVENIQVLQIGQYGVRVDEKTWFGVNEPLTPSHFVPNQGYKVSVVVSKTGKKYISEILGTEVAQEAPAPAIVPAAATTPAATQAIPAVQVPTLDAKSRQIQRQGSYQAALQSPFLGQFATSPDEYLALVRKAADASVKYINE